MHVRILIIVAYSGPLLK